MLADTVWCLYLLVEAHLSVNVFFFFKQKTAYEMLIRDWSSDVCSSDLVIIRRRTFYEAAICVCRQGRTVDANSLGDRLVARRGGLVRLQIGRASCRERVCQYV